MTQSIEATRKKIVSFAIDMTVAERDALIRLERVAIQAAECYAEQASMAICRAKARQKKRGGA